MITKEYMASAEELKEEFKIGSVVEQDGKLLKVVEINNALPTTCFASFPSVTFEEVQKFPNLAPPGNPDKNPSHIQNQLMARLCPCLFFISY